jgi:hypothetical protein
MIKISTKSEIRNPKQIQNLNDQKSKQKLVSLRNNPGGFLFWSFGFWSFEFVSNFDIRISDFLKSTVLAARGAYYKCPCLSVFVRGKNNSRRMV